MNLAARSKGRTISSVQAELMTIHVAPDRSSGATAQLELISLSLGVHTVAEPLTLVQGRTRELALVGENQI